MKHTEKECKGVHCRCMGSDCANQHYADHIQENGLTPTEEKQQEVSGRAKNFQELESHLGGFASSRRFAEWLDEHGYKTFADMPDYVD